MEKMKQNKRFLTGLCALMVAVAMVSVGVTLAATKMFGSYRNTNVFTIGNVDIELIDEYTEPASVKAGDIVQKKVAVKNTGTVPCFVRVYLKRSWDYGTKPDPGADKIVPEVTGGAYDDTSNFRWKLGINPYADDAGSAFKDFDCWYYQAPISVNAETKPLIQQFHLDPPDAGKPYNGITGSITVMAEAVQSEYIGAAIEELRGSNGRNYIIEWPTTLNGETLKFEAKEGTITP
ncbi:MAG: hypothetical protein II828_10235 [Clostridia bacterium]|nr:hypothetical protein [Clostridia bacterium]